MSISKGRRYNVFARDGFACQYCGRRPPEVMLEADHIHPKAKGGSDEDDNLITSCMDCNRGKSAKVPADITPRPDATIKYLRAQQEILEVKRYLTEKRRSDKAFKKIVDSLDGTWHQSMPGDWVPSDQQWRNWLRTFTLGEIEFAVQVTGTGWGWKITSPSQAIKYTSGVLHKLRREQQEMCA